MTEGRSAKVVERHRARQTEGAVVRETVPQLGRLALLASNPNSCQGDREQQPARICKDGRSQAHQRRGRRMSESIQPTVGIDVSQATLDVAVYPSGEHWQTSNDDAAIGELVDGVRALAPALIVLEASGGYETPVLATLASAGLPVVAVNPRQVRDFGHA